MRDGPPPTAAVLQRSSMMARNNEATFGSVELQGMAHDRESSAEERRLGSTFAEMKKAGSLFRGAGFGLALARRAHGAARQGCVVLTVTPFGVIVTAGAVTV